MELEIPLPENMVHMQQDRDVYIFASQMRLPKIYYTLRKMGGGCQKQG